MFETSRFAVRTRTLLYELSTAVLGSSRLSLTFRYKSTHHVFQSQNVSDGDEYISHYQVFYQATIYVPATI